MENALYSFSVIFATLRPSACVLPRRFRPAPAPKIRALCMMYSSSPFGSRQFSSRDSPVRRFSFFSFSRVAAKTLNLAVEKVLPGLLVLVLLGGDCNRRRRLHRAPGRKRIRKMGDVERRVREREDVVDDGRRGERGNVVCARYDAQLLNVDLCTSGGKKCKKKRKVVDKKEKKKESKSKSKSKCAFSLFAFSVRGKGGPRVHSRAVFDLHELLNLHARGPHRHHRGALGRGRQGEDGASSADGTHR